VAEYTQGIDGQITELLRSRGRVAPANLSGIADEDGPVLLARYLELHSDQSSLSFDGIELRLVLTPVPEKETVSAETEVRPAPRPSPVDQVLQAPVGSSLLDTKSSGGHVPRWWWVLPLSIPVVGGPIAWWFTRETNRPVARALFITGLVVTVLTFATMGPAQSMMRGLTTALTP